MAKVFTEFQQVTTMTSFKNLEVFWSSHLLPNVSLLKLNAHLV